ncbi:MAG: MAPEG family protein [Salaquimonas sp.]
MEFIDPIWSFASEWKIRLLVLIVLANMYLAVRLYTVMSKARFKAAKEGRVTTQTYRATQNEPEDLAVYNRAVANQFESPVLFYALISISLAIGVSSWFTVIIAAAYVAFRWQHANEMIGEHVVLKRRKIFVRSIQILLVLMVEVGISTILKV